MTIRGEGSAQTSIQQGLAKTWYLASNSASLTDSFNVSSTVDVGTGNYKYFYTNNFSNANYSVTGICAEGSVFLMFNSSRATDNSINKIGNTSGSVTDAQNTAHINGDLA
jgi:hypothetical protein